MNTHTQVTRRRALATIGAVAFVGLPRHASAAPPVARMGVTAASFAIRRRVSRRTGEPFDAPLTFLEHCRQLGAGGVQIGIGNWDRDTADRLRATCEEHGVYIEGQVRLPDSDNDAQRFEQQLKIAKEAGVGIARTVTLFGRRYENFDTLDAWRRFRDRAWRSLTRAAPIAERVGVRLALENHKDWRVDELIDILRRLDSEHVGVCLDTGNNIALLDQPMRVVEHLAPLAITTHLKDMAVQPHADGFQLSEVPLGRGILDLPAVVRLCRKHNPAITFNLEMITRDPLIVPCLTDRYWQTFEKVNGIDLARTLRLVRDRPPTHPVPQTGRLNNEERIALEQRHVEQSFRHAREQLKMTAA